MTKISYSNGSDGSPYINILNFINEGHRDAVYEQVRLFLIEREGEHNTQWKGKDELHCIHCGFKTADYLEHFDHQRQCKEEEF